MSSEDQIKIELLLDEIKRLSHQCTTKENTKGTDQNGEKDPIAGYEDLFDVAGPLSFKIDGQTLEEFKQKLADREEEAKEKIENLEKEVRRQQCLVEENEKKNLEQKNIIEELEQKLSQVNDSQSEPFSPNINANSTKEKAHIDVVLEHVRQQLQDLQTFVKVPEETFESLQKEINDVKQSIGSFNAQLKQAEDTNNQIEPLVKDAQRVNANLEEKYLTTSRKLDSLLQDYWKLEKSLKEKEIETKNVQDIATKRTEQNHKIGQQRDGLAKQVWEYDDLLKQTREQRDQRLNDENRQLRQQLFDQHVSGTGIHNNAIEKSVNQTEIEQSSKSTAVFEFDYESQQEDNNAE